MSNLPALTDKQERFCLEYVQDYNATQAAIRAGYSEQTARQIASEVLSKPHIQTRVRDLSNQSADELGITKRWLLTKLKESVEVNFPHVEIGYTQDGDPVALLVGNPSAANKALELLMKHSGHLVEKVRHEGGIDITINGVPVDLLR